MNALAWKEVIGLIVMAVVMIAIPYVLQPYLSLAKVKAARAWADFEKDQPRLAVYLAQFAHVAVVAAEQVWLKEVAFDKKDYAVKVVQAWLDEEGYGDIDLVLIEAAVEEAVMKVFNPDRLGFFSDPDPDVVG